MLQYVNNVNIHLSGNHFNDSALVWISSTKLLNGVWIWRTNYKPVTYTNFELNPMSHEEHCNVFRVANGTWFNTSCTEFITSQGNFIKNTHNVVCEPISEKMSYNNLRHIGADNKAKTIKKKFTHRKCKPHHHHHHHHGSSIQQRHKHPSLTVPVP